MGIAGHPLMDVNNDGEFNALLAQGLVIMTREEFESLRYGYESVPGDGYAERRRQRALQNQRAGRVPGKTMYFDFEEQSGAVVYEKFSQRPATLTSGSSIWTRDRGVLFNGVGAYQFAANTMDSLAGDICDLSTLSGEECIRVAFVYQHDPALSNQHPLFYYGCSGENTCGGWGIVARTDGKVFFYHRAVGSASEFSMALSNRRLGNDGANNSLSAVSLEIRINPVDPDFFEIAYADRPLEAGAEINSTGFGNNAYMKLKGDGTGTGAAKHSTLGPLTIGGKPNATYTSLAQVAGGSGAKVGLRQLAIQRYKYVPGAFHCAILDMAEDPKSMPLSFYMEA